VFTYESQILAAGRRASQQSDLPMNGFAAPSAFPIQFLKFLTRSTHRTVVSFIGRRHRLLGTGFKVEVERIAVNLSAAPAANI